MCEETNLTKYRKSQNTLKNNPRNIIIPLIFCKKNKNKSQNGTSHGLFRHLKPGKGTQSIRSKTVNTVKNSQKWSKMVKNVQKWSGMVNRCQKPSIRSKTVKNRENVQKRSTTVKNGQYGKKKTQSKTVNTV